MSLYSYTPTFLFIISILVNYLWRRTTTPKNYLSQYGKSSPDDTTDNMNGRQNDCSNHPAEVVELNLVKIFTYFFLSGVYNYIYHNIYIMKNQIYRT